MKGTFNNKIVITKITYSLLKDYNNFIQNNIIIINKELKLNDIIAKLLTLKPYIRERK